jgi:hypothetical protein
MNSYVKDRLQLLLNHKEMFRNQRSKLTSKSVLIRRMIIYSNRQTKELTQLTFTLA